MANTLFQGLEILSEGFRKRAISNEIGEASIAVQELSQQEEAGNINQKQFRQQSFDQAKLLQQRLLEVGANPSQVQSAFQAFAPKQFGSSEQQLIFGLNQGNSLLTRQALEAMSISDQRKLGLIQAKDVAQETTAIRKEARKEAIDIRKAATKGGTASEKVVAGYATRIKQTSDVFDRLEKAGFDRTSSLARLEGLLPGEFMSSERLQQDQAERNFLNAVLRRESGAVISPSEFESGELQYFPRPGDGPAVLNQKRANREQIFVNYRAEAGIAFDEKNLVPSSLPPGASKELFKLVLNSDRISARVASNDSAVPPFFLAISLNSVSKAVLISNALLAPSFPFTGTSNFCN